MGEELVFCLFELADTKQLFIGSIESIRIPQGFDTRSVTENLKRLASFRDKNKLMLLSYCWLMWLAKPSASRQDQNQMKLCPLCEHLHLNHQVRRVIYF